MPDTFYPAVNPILSVDRLPDPVKDIVDREFTYLKGDKNTAREYFNPERLAAVIGAIIDTGYGDVVTTGSVGTDGTGAYSVTHYNGNNIDFKYLRTDKKRPRIDITGGVVYTDNIKLDISRQNTLMNSFYKFGFGRTEKCLSYTLHDGTMLNHCKLDSAHNDHLHLNGFKANYN